MALIAALPDVSVPGAKFERPSHDSVLVFDGLAGQIKVHLVLSAL